MKRLWIFAGLLLLAVACGKKFNEANTFVAHEGGKTLGLSIVADEAPEGLVELHKFDGSERVFIDSFKVDQPTFEGAVVVGDPTYYTLSFEDGQVVSFVMNADPIVVHMPKDADPYVEGGLDNELHQEFQKLNEDINSEAQGLRQQLMQADEEGRMKIQEDYMAFVERAKGSIMAFIEKSKTSIVAVSAVSMLDPDEDLAVMQEVANSLTSKYPNAPIVKTFAEQIKGLAEISVGAVAPDFELKTMEGESVSLSSLRGQYVMIDFWASWCRPCRMENPFVKEVYQEYASKGFQILGVSVDQDAEAWKKAVKDDALPWIHVIDAESSVAESYNVTGIPFTVLLDKEGKIIAKGLRSEGLKKELEKLL